MAERRLHIGGVQQAPGWEILYIALTGLNESFLSAFLAEAGFERAGRVENFGVFKDTSAMLFKGVPISLNMLAFKPGGQ